MIEVKIPKELDGYEAKFVGPFTLRQTIAVVCALPAVIFLYNFLQPYLSDMTGFICLIPAVGAYLFGWFKPYGMKFEVFLRSVFVTSVLAPTKRKYKSNNYYKMLMSEDFEEDEGATSNKNSKKKKKKTPSPSVPNYRTSKKAIF